MPITSVAWSQNVARQFENRIRGFLLTKPSLYNYFKANGLVHNVGAGQDRVTYLAVSEPDSGRLTSNLHDYTNIVPQWTEVSVGLNYLVYRILISKDDVDRFSTHNWLRGNLIQDTIDQVMPKAIDDLDKILAWGDSASNLNSPEQQFYGSNRVTGIFNGGTTIGGGIDGDDDMQNAGDYIATVETMLNAMRAAKHDLDQYMLFSDLTTYKYAALENQFYSTVGITERQRILEMKEIKDWETSPNFNNGSSYRMAMIAPRQNNTPIGDKNVQNNVELFMGYDFEVYPDANGGLVDNYYIWHLVISFRLVEHRSTAIQRTGDLTLT